MNRFRAVAAVICIIFVFSLVLIPFANADWVMFRADTFHSGAGTGNSVLTPTLLWKYTTGNLVESSPAVVSGVVYIGSQDGNVYALNAANGTKLWNYTTGGLVLSSPAVVNNVVYIGSQDGDVYALNAANGAKIWNFTVGNPALGGTYVTSSPAVVNNIVYINDNSGDFYALDATSGTKIWNTTLGSFTYYIEGSPAVVNGVVYIGSRGGPVFALNAATGAQLWSTANYFAAGSSPTVVNNVVYVGSWDGNVYALDAISGAILWNYTTGNSVESSPAVVGGVVYIGSYFGNVYALDATSGAKLWNYTIGGWVKSSPAVVDGVVYIGSQDYRMYALDATSGAKLWSYITGGIGYSSPAVDGGVVYIGSEDGNVYALGTSSTSSPSPGTSGSSNSNLTTNAWVPPAQNGAAACIVTAGIVSVVALVLAAVSSTPAGATGGFLDKLIGKVREFLPKTFKSWLEGVIASKRKLKIEEKTGSPYFPTKSEIVVYVFAIFVLTFSFAYVEVNNLSQLWLVLPTFFVTSIIVALVKTYVLTVYSRKRGVWTEFKLWYFGVVMFLVSSLAFRAPFSSPTRTVHHSRNFTKRLEVTLSCAGIVITLGFAGLFFILLKSGFALIGGTGLAMCLIAAFFEMFPLEPMGGKIIFKYNKVLWAGFFLITLALYGAWLAKML